MRGIARYLAIVFVAAGLSGCAGTGSQWVTPGPAQTCTVTEDGAGLDSPANNSVGLPTNGLIISTTITYTVPPGVAIFWVRFFTVTLTGSNGTTIDLQLNLTTNSPVKPYWAGVAPALAPRTFYVVSEQGQPAKVIGCFTTG